MWRPATAVLLLASAAVQFANAAIQVNLDDQSSIRSAAALVAEDLFTFYPRRPGWFTGLLDIPPPDGLIHWWISGSFWATLLDYRHASGDTKYDSFISEALLAQVGDDKNYLPRNWTSSIGNDDQAFWALSTLIAAETKFPDPPSDKPQWLALAQAVFNEQMMSDRRAPTGGNCSPGLRWQRVLSSAGYTYINTISNACFFNVGVRLARYTGNMTYADEAAKIAESIFRLQYIDNEFNVYDGAHLPEDCKDINKVQYSYNAAIMLQGCAYMYNITNGTQIWKDRVDGLITQTQNFFFPDNGPAIERSCEPQGKCNIDQRVFKGFLHRWMASAGQLAPYAQARIQAILKTSTAAAMKTCSGGDTGRMCAFAWTTDAFTGAPGAAEQMNALGALTSLLMTGQNAPVTNLTGGTSAGNPDAGSKTAIGVVFKELTTGDRAGGGILTAIVVAGALGVFGWMSLD